MVRILEKISDFRSDDSLPVKTGSCPTVMVDPLFDAQYPSYPSLVKVSRCQGLRMSTSGFIGKKPEIRKNSVENYYVLSQMSCFFSSENGEIKNRLTLNLKELVFYGLLLVFSHFW